MAIAKGDEILASDVVEKIFDTESKHKTLNSRLDKKTDSYDSFTWGFPPGHKIDLGFKIDTPNSNCWGKTYVRDVGDETWILLTDLIVDDSTHHYAYLNDSRVLKEFRLEYYIQHEKGLFLPTIIVDADLDFSIRGGAVGIAKAGEIVRVLNSGLTAFLTKGGTAVTVALYNKGRINYV